MQSLLYGLLAALTWGLHDFCVRHLSQKLAAATMLLGSLVAGSLVLLLAIIFTSAWKQIAPGVAGYAAVSGACYALACFGLYKAFAIGPVRLVAPICGAYPVLSFALAASMGQPIRWDQWLATFSVVAGIALVARQAGNYADTQPRSAAMIWATLGAIGFALTFAFGQKAVHSAGPEAAAELLITLISRMAAIAIVGGWVIYTRLPLAPLRPHLPVLGLMGALDVTALGLVIAAGGLANPEFASVASSLFGLVTVLLAWRFLREQMVLLQWGGVGLVFAGIAWLAAG